LAEVHVMQAMVLERPGLPLRAVQVPKRAPGFGQVLVKVAACGVCRTDLHVVDGELTEAKLPIIPGHEIVGRVESVGPGVGQFRPGDRVGIPWLGHTCGSCAYCTAGRENLCDAPQFTGYQIDGGYAEYATADASYCFGLPESYSDVEAAPLLCAGLIGYRSLRMTGKAEHLGIYGFGGSAQDSIKYSRFGVNAVFTEPLERQTALKLVKATHSLVLHEFRRYVRVPVATEVAVTTSEGRRFAAMSQDISSGGLSLKGEVVAPGTALEISFALLTLPRIWVRGSVTWAKKDEQEIGIKFDPQDERRTKIKEWIDAYLGS
jgi:D-arabinose 1-dehydrogenase-like Zn-dependent alcohol dehydrogenase